MFGDKVCRRFLLYAFVVFTCGVSSLKERRFIDSHVTCAQDFIQLVVRFNSHLWQTLPSKIDMHLNDEHCKPFFVNSSHVFIKTPHNGCGTKSKVTRDHVIFTNTFIAREETGAGQLVSFFPDVEVGFRCTYDRKKAPPASAPLQLDKLHSSPENVTTYYGLPVELRCTFKYGAHPVRAVITHEGKTVASQQNGTQTVTVTVGRLNKEYGLYTCLAEDANHKKITHNIMLRKIDSSSISVDGKKISCTPNEMQLTLDRVTYPWLHPNFFDIHLMDDNCRPYHMNFTHIIVKTTYGECKTVKKNSADGVIYRNILMAFVKARPGELVTRLPDVLFPFQCRFDRKQKAPAPLKRDVKILSPKEPLTLVKSKSSPPIVKTYKKFDVRLVCTFKGGDPPVNITLTRRGRRLTDGVVVKGKVLFGTVKTNHWAAFGSYNCIATDAKGNQVKYRINLKKAGARDLTSSGLTVMCKKHYINVALNRLVYPWLDPGTLHMNLIQSNCTAYNVTDMQIRIQAPLYGCGTRTLRKNKFVLESRNVFIAREKRRPGFGVTYLPDTYFPFVCRYEITRSAGKIVFKPLEPLTLVKSKSSPPIVKTYKKFDIRLVCTFKGGDPPVNITLTRRGRRLTDGVVVKGKVLFGTVKTNHWAAFESYQCIATDAKGNQVKYRINLKKAGARDLTSSGLTVMCKNHYMDVALNRLVYPWLDPGTLHMNLIQSNCTAYNVTDMQIRIQAPLYGCGTRTLRKNKFVLESRNVFIAREKRRPGFGVTYLPDTYFPFVCRYEITRFAGKIVFKPLEPLTLDQSMSSSRKIFSPLNMAVKLRCTFHGGEPPVQVSIIRHKAVIARAQGRMLSFVLEPRFQDGGRYVCQATDALRKTVRHVINLEIPVNGVIFNKGAAELECGSRFTTTTLDRAKLPWLNSERMRMHLNDPGCRPYYVTPAHVSFKMPLGGCGSRHITSPRKIIFTNRVFIVENGYRGYKEREMKTLMEIHFLCKYRRIGLLSESISQKKRLL
ncbi:hypothetical protein ACROYT_G016078 [Oculina patagonica]